MSSRSQEATAAGPSQVPWHRHVPTGTPLSVLACGRVLPHKRSNVLTSHRVKHPRSLMCSSTAVPEESVRHRKVKGTREEGGAGHWPHLQVPEPALGNQSSGLSNMNVGIAISGLSSRPSLTHGMDCSPREVSGWGQDLVMR